MHLSKSSLARGTQPAPLLVFGEVLFDCFPDGHRVLGGAPFNVAWGLKGLGRDVTFISAVGEDADGREIRNRMKAWGMDTQALQADAAHPTGEVRITLENDEPSYEIRAPRAWDFIEDEGYEATGLIYHGLLALRSETSRGAFERIASRSKAPRFFDVNLRPPYDSMDILKRWMRGVDWLKLNIDELAEILNEGVIDFAASEKYIERLRDEFRVGNVLLTGGAQGALIQGAYGEAVCAPAPTPAKIVDTVGAGDAFSVAAIHGILSGMSVELILEQASLFAARVCAMPGATCRDLDFYR